MKRSCFGFACGLLLPLVTASAQEKEAAEKVLPALRPGATIGVIDMERAFLGHPGRKAAEERAEKARKEARQTFLELSNELKKLLQQHQEVTTSVAAGGSGLAAKRERAEELLKAAGAKEIEVAKLKTIQERDLEKLFLAERGKLMDEVRAAVREHNEGAGLNLVLDISAVRHDGIPLVVDVRDLHDITDAVIARLVKAATTEGE